MFYLYIKLRDKTGKIVMSANPDSIQEVITILMTSNERFVELPIVSEMEERGVGYIRPEEVYDFDIFEKTSEGETQIRTVADLMSKPMPGRRY